MSVKGKPEYFQEMLDGAMILVYPAEFDGDKMKIGQIPIARVISDRYLSKGEIKSHLAGWKMLGEKVDEVK